MSTTDAKRLFWAFIALAALTIIANPVRGCEPEQQCTARTAAGTQCSRKATAGQTTCWQHNPARKGERVADAPTYTVPPVCGAPTKAGGKCQNRPKAGGRCHLHK